MLYEVEAITSYYDKYLKKNIEPKHRYKVTKSRLEQLTGKNSKNKEYVKLINIIEPKESKGE